MSARARGLVCAVVVCPVFGWVAASYGQVITHGRLRTCRRAGNAILRRERSQVIRASVGAAFVCFLGLVIYALVFFLTVPPEFFQ
jgi:hypothetical protein